MRCRSKSTDGVRTNNATIEVIIEQDKFNNSLAGWLNCPNGRKAPRRGSLQQKVWVETYLQNGQLPHY